MNLLELPLAVVVTAVAVVFVYQNKIHGPDAMVEADTTENHKAPLPSYEKFTVGDNNQNHVTEHRLSDQRPTNEYVLVCKRGCIAVHILLYYLSNLSDFSTNNPQTTDCFRTSRGFRFFSLLQYSSSFQSLQNQKR